MYIDQITLTNFRGYYGDNTLQFSTNSAKNISIIAGNNGFGKTTLLTALIWGLYGKLMVDVDDIYRNEINQAGGYKAYCNKIMSRLATAQLATNQDFEKQDKFIENKFNKDYYFSTTIIFSKLNIPHLSCEKVEINRRYYPEKEIEKLEILIDGRANELTKNVGPDIFINDFILPKEIAKFFFFDAEKIVSMAEIKTAEQKRYLSRAYAEVLGIKKYTDLKENLENLQYRLRKKSAVKTDRDRLAQLNKQAQQNEKILMLYNQQIEEKHEFLNAKKIASDKYQEQLIREGSAITIEELRELKENHATTVIELNSVKARFSEMLDLAPFAMLVPQLELVKQQLEDESNNSGIATSLLEAKFKEIAEAVMLNKTVISESPFNEQELLKIIKAALITEQKSDCKPLLDFSPEQQNGFLAIYETVKGSYKESFKRLVADQKRVQAKYQNLQKKFKDAEKKGKDPIIIQIREAKQKLDIEIATLEDESSNLTAKIVAIRNETSNLGRQISELTKKITIEDIDTEKDQTTARLIAKLNKVIYKLKTSKKQSLEFNLKQAFSQLMHKADFINRVEVIVQGELIDVKLLDKQGIVIEKETLSKGEQQLYATALLKALIEESNISFPVFIDSPLQKFDKIHSKNIITDFYSNLSSQVILFPLLQKELSEDEYQLLEPHVGKTYLIQQIREYESSFLEVDTSSLFYTYDRRLLNV